MLVESTHKKPAGNIFPAGFDITYLTMTYLVRSSKNFFTPSKKRFAFGVLL